MVGLMAPDVLEGGGRRAVGHIRRRPPFSSWIVACIAVTLLTLDLPLNWFRVPIRDAGVSDTTAVAAPALTGAILILLAGFAVLQLLRSPEAILVATRCEPLLAIFVALALASVFWSSAPDQTLRLAVGLATVLILGYWMATIFTLNEVLRIFALCFAAGAIIHYLFIFGLPQYGVSNAGWVGVMGHKNPLGRVAVLGVLVLLISGLSSRRWRLLNFVFVAANVGLVVGSQSKTSLAALAILPVALGVFRVFRSRRTLYGAAMLTILGSAVVIGLFATANFVLITDILDKDVTLSGRTDLWIGSLRAVLDRPVLGYAWGGFWRGWFSPSHDVLVYRNWQPPHSHNAIIEYALAFGLLGAVLGLLLFGRSVSRSIRFIRLHGGWTALLPLGFMTYAVLFSVTEFGVITRSSAFLMFVVVAVVVGRDAVNEASREVSESPRRTPTPSSRS